MNLRKGFLTSIVILALSPLAIAADKVNMDDPNLPMYRDGQDVEYVGISDKDSGGMAKNPECTTCNKTGVGIRSATQPGQTDGSSDGGSGAKGIDN